MEKFILVRILLFRLLTIGSVNSELVAKDFSEDQMRDFSVRKQIIYESESTEEINKIESLLIVEHGANNPEIGYNKWPKFKD